MVDPVPLPEETVSLIAQFQAGDADAGDALFRRYYPRVRRIVLIRARANGLRHWEVEDILQETFLSATRSIDRFRPQEEGGFINWLACIATNKMIDIRNHRRAQKRDKGREVPLAGLGSADRSSGDWQPEADTTRVPDKVARKEEARDADACLATIREDYREVILLRDLAGCSWPLISEQLGCASVDSARHLHARARAAAASAMRRRKQGP